MALRNLRLSLAQVAQVMDGEASGLEDALATHEAALEAQARELSETLGRVRALRRAIARGDVPAMGEIAQVVQPSAGPGIAFDLPWPWGGERFELRDVRALNHIVGPLGSGKTRLAMEIARAIPGAAFLGLDRTEAETVDDALKSRVERALRWLVEEGATATPALLTLVTALEGRGASVLVIDMVEQGLDHATQEALISWLRCRAPGATPLFLMTRSSAILDLEVVGPDETILFCPANHAPPFQVAPYPGAAGYEALASCLATPEVRARTEGVIAWRPPEVA